jgi:hypothetical protein
MSDKYPFIPDYLVKSLEDISIPLIDVLHGYLKVEMLETEFKYFYLTGETKHYQRKTVKLDVKTFDIFLDTVLNNYKKTLSELETEFKNL